MEYQKLKVKRFAKKSYKHAQDGRYWKKFQCVYSKLEQGFMCNDVSFAGMLPNLVATAIATRVDLWKLQQPKEDQEAEQIVPYQSLMKFEDQVTAIKLREDGQVILVGDKLGNVQLVEIKQKITLRNYKGAFKNQVNSMDFGQNRRCFVACANETSWKYFDIQQSQGAIFTCQAAHSDNIKQVMFLPNSHNDLVLSSGQDKTIKLWKIDLENIDQPYELISSLKFTENIENFTFLTLDHNENEKHLYAIVANGNMLSFLYIGEQQENSDSQEYKSFDMKIVQNIHAFQKPIMKVIYDQERQRIIAGGLDQQLKFFQIFQEDKISEFPEWQLRLQYKIKLPQAIFQLSMSSDGQHQLIALVDGSLFIKSKQLEEFKEEINDEMKMIMDAFQPNFKSTSKNYKYFFRGQYDLVPEASDIISGMKVKKQKLQPYEMALKKFNYKEALSSALKKHGTSRENPEIVVALLEELMVRGGLEISLARRDPEELLMVLQFIKWKIEDSRYQKILIFILEIIIDMYSAVLTSPQTHISLQCAQIVHLLTEEMRQMLQKEMEIQSNLLEIQGQIKLIAQLSNIL